MKSKIVIFSAFALIVSACSTGSFVTSSYVDDVYFTPGSVPPPVVVSKSEPQSKDLRTKSADRFIISEIQDNEEGSKTMNNYIFDGEDAGSYADAQLYNLDQMELAQSDTTIYYDENEVKYVINNYYEGDNMDFGYRIRRFHRPFFYDPYYYDYYGWNSWYYPYSSWSYGWDYGWGGWGWGSSWYSPYYSWGYPYHGWYSPYYSYYGWGGYPYYYNSWYSPYYGGYWGHALYIDREDYRYGQRRDFNTSAVYGNAGARRSGTTAISNNQSPLKSAQPGISGVGTAGRPGSISGVEGGGRPAREGTISGASQNARTHTELRRDPSQTTNTRSRYTSTSSVRGAGGSPSGIDAGVNSVTGNTSRQAESSPSRFSNTTQGTYTRPVSRSVRDNSGNAYTPSYNQQRTVNRSTYNVQSPERQSSVTQGSPLKNAVSPSSTYTRPSSTRSSSTQTYRSTSTYNRSSSGVSSGSGRVAAPSGNYSAPSRSVSPSSSGSYSSPSRSYSSPASSGSFGGGSSSGSSGSSGSRSSGGSSHSGRR